MNTVGTRLVGGGKYHALLITATLSLFLVLPFIFTACGGGGAASTGADATANTSTGTATTTGTSPGPNQAVISGTLNAASGISVSELANAAVYVIGQEANGTTTDANGNYTLLVDTSKISVVTQKPFTIKAVAKAAKNEYGVIAQSSSKLYGKKFEVIANPGDSISGSAVNITKVGSVSGKAFLQGKTDHTGIMVYIPGTSFLAMTDQNGNYTISNVPAGSYPILRAEKTGFNYSVLSNYTVQSEQATIVADQTLLISTGSKGTMLINGGATISTSRTVSINVSATDNAFLMMLAEEPTFQNVSWVPVASMTSFTFSADGLDTVYIKFADANGLASSTYSASITVDTNPTVAATSPSGTISSSKPALAWDVSALPNPMYHVQLASDSGFVIIVEEATNLTSPSYAVTKALQNTNTYYFRVAVIDSAGKEWNWCTKGSFTINIGSVTAIQPAGTASSPSIVGDTRPLLDWADSALQNVKYVLQVSDGDSLFGTTVVNATLTAVDNVNKTISSAALSSSIMTNPMVNLHTYYWRVAVIDANGVQGSWSSVYAFQVDLSSVSLSSPTNLTFTNNTTPTFTWTANANAVSYNLVVSTNSNLSSPAISKTGITALSYAIPAPSAFPTTASTVYYWAVTPVDINGVLGTQSTAQNFTLDTTAPTGTISINAGASNTSVETVSLTLSAADANTVSQMYVSMDGTFADGAWENYATSKILTYTALAATPTATITAYVKYKDNTGNISNSLSTSITLQRTLKSGIISVSESWTLAGSPYVITNSIQAPTGVTITVDPGVEVQFAGPYTIQIGGAITANGTTQNPIKFTAIPTLTNSTATMLKFKTTNLALSTLNYVTLEKATVGIEMVRDCSGTLAVNNATITASLWADACTPSNNCSNAAPIPFLKIFSSTISGTDVKSFYPYGGGVTIANSTITTSNIIADPYAVNGITIQNSTVSGGTMSIGCCSALLRIDGMVATGGSVVRSTVTNATIGSGWGSPVDGPLQIVKTDLTNTGINLPSATGTFVDSTFTYNGNFGTANQITIGNGTLDYSVITGNGLNTGLIVQGYAGYSATGAFAMTFGRISNNKVGISLVAGSTGTFSMANTNIITSSTYALEYLRAANVTIANNYWGTTTVGTINALIYDASDNINYGIVTYAPILNVPDATAVPR